LPRAVAQGAEIIRLYHTLLGREGFRKGMDLYFQRHDGQVRAACEAGEGVLCGSALPGRHSRADAAAPPHSSQHAARCPTGADALQPPQALTRCNHDTHSTSTTHHATGRHV
jgi:hypothetical protein